LYWRGALDRRRPSSIIFAVGQGFIVDERPGALARDQLGPVIEWHADHPGDGAAPERTQPRITSRYFARTTVISCSDRCVPSTGT